MVNKDIQNDTLVIKVDKINRINIYKNNSESGFCLAVINPAMERVAIFSSAFIKGNECKSLLEQLGNINDLFDILSYVKKYYANYQIVVFRNGEMKEI